jgi:hypothetical protein
MLLPLKHESDGEKYDTRQLIRRRMKKKSCEEENTNTAAK